ncbi:ATP-binding protein [Streptomyces longisporoflavus]|uniref:ATP-binding protein n=1 Tax=Streptomyces longisporoflavus TaxID=28044 RepID=A0ABW7QZ76_9ACTN
MRKSGQGRRADNLPPEPTSFIGREAELRAVVAAVTDTRLVTLTGVGGVGKTRLAQRAGAELRDGFPDGVWLVGLAQLSEPALMALALYEALCLADQSTRSAIEVVADWLADKKLLLILDCCEHLAADCADFVRTLLDRAPGVHVLATSRRPLSPECERVIVVPPLPVLVHGSRPSDAALLFMARTGVTEADGSAVAEICAHLEGIPLAIELAAARLPEMDLDALRQRLHDRYETLAPPSAPPSPGARHGEADPRHQTLRTTIGWSHELCTPQERLAWARLSVFADGFEQEAAELVCAGGPLGSGQIGALLSALVDKSLLLSVQTRRGPRYSMLDTVREYGEEWLRGLGEERRFSERHRDYYRWLARTGGRKWAGPDQVYWYERCTAEHANLRAALECCLADPDPRDGLEMTGSLWFFWLCCGFQREGRHYMDRALAKTPDAGPGPERFWALWACGMVTLVQGDFEAGARLTDACTSLTHHVDDPAAADAALYLEGALLALTGRPALAVDLVARTAGSADCGGGSPAIRLCVLSVLAFAHLHLGDFDRATASSDTLRAECERYGEQWMRSFAFYMLAGAALGNGDAASAVRHARSALPIKWRLHDVFGAALCIDALASAVDDPEQSGRLLGISDVLWGSVGAAQMGNSQLMAARRASERRARDAIGDLAYEAAFHKGLGAGIDEGVAYALATPEGGTPS